MSPAPPAPFLPPGEGGLRGNGPLRGSESGPLGPRQGVTIIWGWPAGRGARGAPGMAVKRVAGSIFPKSGKWGRRGSARLRRVDAGLCSEQQRAVPATAASRTPGPRGPGSAIFPVACELSVSKSPAFLSPLVFLAVGGARAHTHTRTHAHARTACLSLQDNLCPKCSPSENNASSPFLAGHGRWPA